MLPTRGKPFGPGGNGGRRKYKIYRHSAYSTESPRVVCINGVKSISGLVPKGVGKCGLQVRVKQ